MATFLKSFLSERSIIDICLRPDPALNLVKDVGTKALTTTVSAAAAHRKLRNTMVSKFLPCYPEVITAMTIADDIRTSVVKVARTIEGWVAAVIRCFDFVLLCFTHLFFIIFSGERAKRRHSYFGGPALKGRLNGGYIWFTSELRISTVSIMTEFLFMLITSRSR